MAYKIEYLSDLQTLVVTYEDPFDVLKDTGATSTELLTHLEGRTEVLHFIADFSYVKISFSDLTMGMADAFTQPNNPYTNPLLKTYTVGDDDLVSLGAKAAAEQEQYGHASVKLYKSKDEALADVKEALSGQEPDTA